MTNEQTMIILLSIQRELERAISETKKLLPDSLLTEKRSLGFNVEVFEQLEPVEEVIYFLQERINVLTGKSEAGK